MFKSYCTYLQYLLPQHLLSELAGTLANSKTPWLKRQLIKRFMQAYRINLDEALIENPDDYASFNDFFIRHLKPACRPIAPLPNDIACPVDGFIAEIGNIRKNQLLQAKDCYFNLETLLGNDKTLAEPFYDGAFATLYLAPQNYHRVHIPIDAELTKMIYVPGKLFSVNRMTSELIPNIFSRNERLITVFNTAAGPMIVILVGALIVGSIQTVWMQKPIRDSKIISENFSNISFKKGDELGYFKLGSTAIILFGKNKVSWHPSFTTQTLIKMGQSLGHFHL